jgi:serine/threonine protein kinase
VTTSPGTTFGRYELVRKLAAGGMAEVFHARQWGEAGFFRDVVVKRLFGHLVAHAEIVRLFQHEARLMSELSHPNIPQVLDLGFESDTWYTVMELVEGWNLVDAWQAGARGGTPMPLHVALAIALQVCEALHHAHERPDRAGRPMDIVHRDVTPHNVMVTRDGVVKLMDFGVAQSAAFADPPGGGLRGTLQYMSPEQVRGQLCDRRADVFSLGVVLYELTTGTRLFRGPDPQVMIEIVENDVMPPTERAPGYPPELEAVVLSALARDRDVRIGSAAELAYQLEVFAAREGLPVTSRVIGEYLGWVFAAERVADPALALVPGERSVVIKVDPRLEEEEEPW